MTLVHVPTATSVNWDAELRGAQMLLKSGLAPQSLRTPEAALYVILVGRDLGLTPTQSLRSINVIQGKVEIAADMQLSLFKREGGKAIWRVLSDTIAEVELTHPNGDQHVERFTLDDAKRAKLTGDNWQKYPKAMLRSRAITAGMKSIGFDALAGVYAPGEISGDDRQPAPDPVPDEPTAAETIAATIEANPTDAVATFGLEAARAFVIPFGPLKGQTVGAVPVERLQGAYDWACGKGKFTEFQEAAVIVLQHGEDVPAEPATAKPSSFTDAPIAPPQDDLPF